MLLSNFHTHTYLCKHATGTPADYIRAAATEHVPEGIECAAFGISDHCPYPDSTWRGSRMSVADVPEYLRLVEEARAASPFPFYWGFECEWFPAHEAWLRELKASTGAEYYVYGAHWVQDSGEFYYIPDVSDRTLLRRYVDLTVQGIGSGLFDIFAHPDLFLGGFTKFNSEVRAASRDIIDAAIAAGLPMEVNGLGLHKTHVRTSEGIRPPYPVREFWEMAASAGARIICSSDAHRPEDSLSNALDAWSFAHEIGITSEVLVDPRLPVRLQAQAPVR